MGLDTVAIVLRVEETFGVDLPDDELGSVATVGDLYQLLMSRLDGSYEFNPVRRLIVPVPSAVAPARTDPTNTDTDFSQGEFESKKRGDAEVWQVLREIIADKLQIRREEVVPEAHFGRDLGCD